MFCRRGSLFWGCWLSLWSGHQQWASVRLELVDRHSSDNDEFDHIGYTVRFNPFNDAFHNDDRQGTFNADHVLSVQGHCCCLWWWVYSCSILLLLRPVSHKIFRDKPRIRTKNIGFQEKNLKLNWGFRRPTKQTDRQEAKSRHAITYKQSDGQTDRQRQIFKSACKQTDELESHFNLVHFSFRNS